MVLIKYVEILIQMCAHISHNMASPQNADFGPTENNKSIILVPSITRIFGDGGNSSLLCPFSFFFFLKHRGPGEWRHMRISNMEIADEEMPYSVGPRNLRNRNHKCSYSQPQATGMGGQSCN